MVGVPHERCGESPHAFIVLHEGKTATAAGRSDQERAGLGVAMPTVAFTPQHPSDTPAWNHRAAAGVSHAAGLPGELNGHTYSINRSARNRSVCGSRRPSALAVFVFTTISNLAGCCTGRLPGLAPLRILST
jgi:hypothetical protein